MIIAVIVLLAVALIMVTFIFRSDSEQSAELTTNVRASSLTYNRTLDLLSASPSPAIFVETPAASSSPTISPTGRLDATQSATLSATPTKVVTPTEFLTATPIASPTAVTALPRTGWTQNVSIMFIAASVLMFLSFLY